MRWKNIIGWHNYMVSDCGRVHQLNSTLKRLSGDLKPQKTKQGYLQVQLIEGLTRKYVYVHRLVASAFVNNPNGYDYVNHLDNNKENNSYKNLEWCTHKQNMHHALKIGAHPHSDKFNNKRSIAVELINEGKLGTLAIAAETGYTPVSISRIRRQLKSI